MITKYLSCILILVTIMLEVRGQMQSPYLKLKEVAIKLNKSMPQYLDNYTRLDSLSAIPSNTLQYSCTLFSVNKAPASLKKLKSIREEKMLNNIKTEKEFKPYRDNKVTIVYKYYDEDRIFLFSIFLTPEKYTK